MSFFRTAAARLSLVAVVIVAAAGPARPAVACGEQASIASSEVDAQLNQLLAQEGLSSTRAGKGIMRAIDLDGDPSTAEALVDVVSPEHCVALTCTTLVVRRGANGKLVAIGHGTWLQPLRSRTSGWMDLGETAPLVTVRALRMSGAHYE